jgi:hypothetical protein
MARIAIGFFFAPHFFGNVVKLPSVSGFATLFADGIFAVVSYGLLH